MKAADTPMSGGHYLLDFFGCDGTQLNSLAFWKQHLPAAANAAELEILFSHFHQFEPQGITGFLLLSTSHISIHTWPEHNYVACDVFSCSSDASTQRAVAYLQKTIMHETCNITHVPRGYVVG